MASLLKCIFYQNIEKVREILDNGFDINCIFKGYYDPHYPARSRVRWDEKITALEYAILLNKPEIIDLLLTYNPDTFPYNDTKTALINAGLYVSVDTLKMLIKYYENKHGPDYTLKYIVNRGIDNYCYGYVGPTPLYWAAISDCIEKTKFLLDYGANPYITSSDGETPIAFIDENIKNLANDHMIKYYVKLLHSIERFNIIPHEIILLICGYMTVPSLRYQC